MAFNSTRASIDALHPAGGGASRKFAVTAAITQPASTVATLFTIVGRIRAIAIFGEVSTVFASGTNNTKLIFNPTGTGASTDMCAVVDTASAAVGTILSITGAVADAMTVGAAPYFAIGQAGVQTLSNGVIEVSTSATKTGAAIWTLVYEPVSTDAVVS